MLLKKDMRSGCFICMEILVFHPQERTEFDGIWK
jgi:hypothetical protein